MDRFQTRGIPIASFFSLSGIGFALFPRTGSTDAPADIILRTVEGNLRARYFAIFLGA